MKYSLRILFLGASMAALAACATTPAPEAASVAPAPEPVAAPVPEKSAHDRLFELFKASDEASLKRNPLNAIFRGDLRYADRLGDGITDEYYAAEKAASESDLTALHALAIEQSDDVVGSCDFVAELHLGRSKQALFQRVLALEVGVLAELDQHNCAETLSGQAR